ncbi:MAG: hypothetical protein KDG89_05335 [Geminicoccaceae bacterium]|nr:hypothetical protein [Geminicoccaceae bacterium]
MAARPILVLLAAAMLAGCTNDPDAGAFGYGRKESVGGVLGALGGAAAGGALGNIAGGGGSNRYEIAVGSALGALFGGMAGSSVGASLDDVDRMRMGRSFGQAMTAPVGTQITWDNPGSGHSGYTTTQRGGTDAYDRRCREYETGITVGGRPQTMVGIACQNPDGTWSPPS